MILAAGKGTRLKPVTDDRVPKPMVKVAGRPLLEHIVDQIRNAGITDLFINLHHQPESIHTHFGDGRDFGVRITYSHEKELLGTAGAVKKLASNFTETFILYYGDNYVEIDLKDMIRDHYTGRAAATIALFPCEQPHMSGISKIDAQRNVIQFVEKPEPALNMGNLANAGIYVLEPSVLSSIPADRPSDFGRDIFPDVLKRGGKIRAYMLNGKVIGVDTPELYAKLESYLAQRKK